MRGREQISWAYDALIRLFPGLARWRSELVALARGWVLEVGWGAGLGLSDFGAGVDGVWGIDPNAASLHRAHPKADLHL